MPISCHISLIEIKFNDKGGVEIDINVEAEDNEKERNQTISFNY